MATTSKFVGFTQATLTKEGRDTFTTRYIVQFDTVQDNPYLAMVSAQEGTPDPVPQLRQQYGWNQGNQVLINRYANSITPTVTDETRKVYTFDVSWSTPEPGQQDPESQNPDPVQRPGSRNIEYIATEKAIEKAKNMKDLSRGNGNGEMRSEGTLGKIVNAAGQTADIPFFNTVYEPLLVWEKAYATLTEIDDLNMKYLGTTNKTKVYSYEPEQLEYMVTESLGKQIENDIEYWMGRTQVKVKKTTRLEMDNVGYDHWEEEGPLSTTFILTRAKVKKVKENESDEDEFEFAADPINLKDDGTKGGLNDETGSIEYQFLELIDYNPLFGEPANPGT